MPLPVPKGRGAWVALAGIRLRLVLGRRIAATIRQLEVKICESGRADIRPEPHILAEALRLLRGHREYLVDSMEAVAAAGINQMDAIQYFHAADTIRDTVVGIAASMALNRENATKDLPIFAFANASDGIKVSARTTRELVARGLDLAAVMKAASDAVGGQGGGHHAAAGATIPPGTESKFLEIANRMVRDQIGPSPKADETDPY